jgi:hypothetical protein
MKIQIFVMPAWIAGIQVCKDASGNIHVNLDSSTPCWNDAIEGFRFKLTEAPPPHISKELTKVSGIDALQYFHFVLFAAFAVPICVRFRPCRRTYYLL